MTETRSALKELQRLDQAIAKQKSAITAFEPQLEEVEGPAITLENEVSALRKRLQEIKVEERRTESSADDKRERMKKLQERLNAVRNVREEAAVHAELEMVRRALEGDETEALTLLDQIRRMEERLSEQEVALEEALAEVGPRRDELLAAQEKAEADLKSLEADRDAFADSIDESERRLYEGIMRGGRVVAVADLTEDGACGHCFSMVPLQLQSEIRHGSAMIRCEGCGVILMPPSDEPEVEAAPEADAAPDAALDEDDGEEAAVAVADDAEPGDAGSDEEE